MCFLHPYIEIHIRINPHITQALEGLKLFQSQLNTEDFAKQPAQNSILANIRSWIFFLSIIRTSLAILPT